MSSQVNIFYGHKDLPIIFELILTLLCNFLVIRERGSKQDLVPIFIDSFDKFQSFCDSEDLFFIVLPEKTGQITLRQIGDDKYRLDPNNSPVIEFSPSKSIGSDLLKVGRIMYSYDTDDDMVKLFKSMIAKIKRKSKKLPDSRGFWSMEDSGSYENLKFWVGQPKPNPLYSLKN